MNQPILSVAYVPQTSSVLRWNQLYIHATAILNIVRVRPGKWVRSPKLCYHSWAAMNLQRKNGSISAGAVIVMRLNFRVT